MSAPQTDVTVVERASTVTVVEYTTGSSVAVVVPTLDVTSVVDPDGSIDITTCTGIDELLVELGQDQVVVIDEGVEGPVGPAGPAGPPGGQPDVYHLVTVSSWTQVHNRSYPPAVRLLTADGEEIACAVIHPDPTHVHIQFPQPFTGTVVLT